MYFKTEEALQWWF